MEKPDYLICNPIHNSYSMYPKKLVYVPSNIRTRPDYIALDRLYEWNEMKTDRLDNLNIVQNMLQHYYKFS
jgi:hypothetical protein